VETGGYSSANTSNVEGSVVRSRLDGELRLRVQGSSRHLDSRNAKLGTFPQI
jgi:hypothetical protein